MARSPLTHISSEPRSAAIPPTSVPARKNKRVRRVTVAGIIAVTIFALWATLKIEGLPDSSTEAKAEFNRGISLGQLGKTDEALAALRTASQLRPSDANTHFILGMALASEGKLDQAVQELRRRQDPARGRSGPRQARHRPLSARRC